MNYKHLLAIALLSLLFTPFLFSEEYQLEELEADYVTTTKVPIDTEIRVKIVRQGDGIGDMIQISSFTQDKLLMKSKFGPGCIVLKSILKSDIKYQDVFKYEIKESTYIGIGMRGPSSRRSSVEYDKGVYKFTYGRGSDQWEFHVKFVEPEF